MSQYSLYELKVAQQYHMVLDILAIIGSDKAFLPVIC